MGVQMSKNTNNSNTPSLVNIAVCDCTSTMLLEGIKKSNERRETVCMIKRLSCFKNLRNG
jgi:hypothetical protein